ncbi:hypothetical protein QTH97_08915 [Variovorax sp. J22R24]|uniref:hypothetical protein n=1 Tax=Variovorax gracilis TaxID=3053502 RepID=UPI002577D529|nr:hypothetical protein [Variovorax sp. J22R24]MDM0105049.1 hypothetical protein [Variovorax sp. J22R24]
MRLSHTRIAARSAILLAAACLQWDALAAEGSSGTWRCGNSYTDRPCEGGRALKFQDARTADQRREADRTTRDARMAADRLERERLHLESVSARRQASFIDNKPQPRMATPTHRDANAVYKMKKRPKDPVYVSRQDPASPPKKRASRSAAEN